MKTSVFRGIWIGGILATLVIGAWMVRRWAQPLADERPTSLIEPHPDSPRDPPPIPSNPVPLPTNIPPIESNPLSRLAGSSNPPAIAPAESRPAALPEPDDSTPAGYSSDAFFAWVRDIEENKTGDLLDQAMNLLSSTQAILRAMGYALLELDGQLDTNALQQLANEPDLLTPLATLDWLNDSDRLYQAQELEWLLQERIENMDTTLDILDGGLLQAGGGRSMMAMLKGVLSGDDLALLFGDLAIRPGQDDFTRLRALMELSDLSDPDDYRKLAETASSNAPALQADITAWMHHAMRATGQLTPEDVEELTGGDTPQRAVLLATTLEFIYDHSDIRLGSGVYPRVQAYLSAVSGTPLTAAEEKAVARIRNLLDEIEMLDPAGGD